MSRVSIYNRSFVRDAHAAAATNPHHEVKHKGERTNLNIETRISKMKRDFWEEVDSLCRVQMEPVLIADWFGVQPQTLEKAYQRRFGKNGSSFSDYCRFKACEGVALLKRKAFQMAVGGNTPMLLFLLKNWGGMADVTKNIEERSLNIDIGKVERVVHELQAVLNDGRDGEYGNHNNAAVGAGLLGSDVRNDEGDTHPGGEENHQT